LNRDVELVYQSHSMELAPKLQRAINLKHVKEDLPLKSLYTRLISEEITRIRLIALSTATSVNEHYIFKYLEDRFDLNSILDIEHAYMLFGLNTPTLEALTTFKADPEQYKYLKEIEDPRFDPLRDINKETRRTIDI
jgi:hypothetical protein